MDQVIIFAVLFSLGYVCGTVAESRHYKSLKKREKEFLNLPCTSTKTALPGQTVGNSWLVQGSTVISVDYFKRILASLRNFFGGNVSSYETLVDRARREAILRMKEQASGADYILNLRVETSTIGGSANERSAVGSVEALAYGTAVWLKK